MDRNNIDLSIIIPVYNTPLEYLKECLESIIKANIKYFYEIIIINDGSTNDEVVLFLEQYKEKHTYIIHKENTGVSNTRNIGLERAKGDFILWLDADDILLSEINNVIYFLKRNTEYDVAYCDLQTFGDFSYSEKKGLMSKFKLIYISNILSVTSVFRKKILEKVSKFNTDLSYAEDWDFWTRIASAGFQFKYLPNPFFLYRKISDGKSLSQQNYDKREEIKDFIKSQFNPHKEITLKEVNKYVIYNFKNNKAHIFKLIIILFFPFIFKYLQKKGIYKNNIIVD